MIRRIDNVVPVSLAVLLHVVIFGSLVVVFDFSRQTQVPMPLALHATLVTENAVVIPPKVEQQPPPDTRAQQQREQEAREKLERLQKIEQQKIEADERKRVAEQERQRKEAEAEKLRQQKAAEAEKERLRLEAEQKREAEIKRQREENERLRQEAEAAARQQELDNEAQRVAAITANARAAYMFAIQQKIERNWVRPANAEVGLECTVRVQQLPGGEVVNVSFGSCNGDATVKRSIESAVFKASPLPPPRDPSVFDRNLTLIFKPKE